MPPGIAALPRPHCLHPAANDFARAAPRLKPSPRSHLPWRCQPHTAPAAPSPATAPASTLLPSSGKWKAVAVPPSARAATHQHSLALPPSLTKPAAPEPCRGVWPQPSAPAAAVLFSPCLTCWVSPLHLTWGECWGRGPPAQGHLATVRQGGENLSAGWRPPLTAC